MLNQCSFIGNLGQDPEIKSFTNGGRIANLRIGVSEKWKAKTSGEQKERTEWVAVVINSDGLVGVAERYLRKGSKVYVSGQLRTRKWQDQTGADRYSTEIMLSGFDAKLVMLDGAKGNEGGGGNGVRRQKGDQGYIGAVDDLDDDSIPFIRSDGMF